jgi:hypothetical protein
VEARKRAAAEAAGEVVELLEEEPESAEAKAKRETQAAQRRAEAAAAAVARHRNALRAKTNWCAVTPPALRPRPRRGRAVGRDFFGWALTP